jgi:protoporphyrinogen/coproporphyrinogen III oxidase
VLEAGGAVGGKMASVQREGFTINRGAQLLPSAYAAAVRIARDAGVASSLQEFVPTLAVLRGGRQYRIRGAGAGMAIDGLRTGLLSPRSKLRLRRLAVDAWRMRQALTYDAHEERARWDTESVAEYCDRRLNSEIRDYLIDPLMRGLFLIDPLQMSVVDFFFTAVNLLGSKMLHYPAGYDFLPKALARQSGDVRFGVRVEEIRRTSRGVVVGCVADGKAQTLQAHGAVVALPAPAAAAVLPELDDRRRTILTGDIEQSVVFGIHLALTQRPPGDTVAITIPSREVDGLGAITFEHIGMPDCAPPGQGLISAYFAHDWCAPRMGRSDDELVTEALVLVDRLLPGVPATVKFAQVDRWAPSTPINRKGMHKLTAEFHRLSDPKDRIQLAGDFTSIATVNACVISGETAAARLAAVLGAA